MPTHANKSYGWIKREGKLGGPGYTKKTTAARHRILAGVVKKYGYRSALGSIMALERSTQISATVRKVLVSDRVWLRETYGAASKKRAAAASPIRRRSIPAHSRVPAAPRSRVEIRGLLARAGFRLLGTGNSVSYTARGERGPRVIAPFPKTMAAARALIKRARPNYREGRAGGGMEASFAAYARAGRPAVKPRRVPSVARRSRKARAAMDRMPRNTWSAARGSSYPTRKPGESDQAFVRRINAWTLGGVKDATRRHATKYPGFAAWMKKQPKQRGGYTRFGEYVDLNTGGSILTPGDYRDKYAREVKGEAYARYNPRRNPQLPMGATHVDTIMVRHKPFMDIYLMPESPEDPGTYGYLGVVRSTGKFMASRGSKARALRGLLMDAKIAAEYAGLLKRPEKERGTRKRKSRMPGGVSTDVYLESQATALFDRKLPEYEDRKKYMLRNGRTECGYHGVPTIRGECVVCAYEADVR
jgi:hypothetical protein